MACRPCCCYRTPTDWIGLGPVRDGRHRVLVLLEVVKPMGFTVQDTMEARRLDWSDIGLRLSLGLPWGLLVF